MSYILRSEKRNNKRGDMITNQSEIYINLSHTKTNLKTAKSLLREIINTDIVITDKTNLKIIEELKTINQEINDYITKFQTLEN